MCYVNISIKVNIFQNNIKRASIFCEINETGTMLYVKAFAIHD